MRQLTQIEYESTVNRIVELSNRYIIGIGHLIAWAQDIENPLLAWRVSDRVNYLYMKHIEKTSV